MGDVMLLVPRHGPGRVGGARARARGNPVRARIRLPRRWSREVGEVGEVGAGPASPPMSRAPRIYPRVGRPNCCSVGITAARSDGMTGKRGLPLGWLTIEMLGLAGAHRARCISPSSIPAPPLARAGWSPARAQGQGSLPKHGRAQRSPVQAGGDPRVRIPPGHGGCGSRCGVSPLMARAADRSRWSHRGTRCLTLGAPPPGSAMRLPPRPGGNVALPRASTRFSVRGREALAVDRTPRYRGYAARAGNTRHADVE